MLVLQIEVDVDLEHCGRVAAVIMPLTAAAGCGRAVIDMTDRFVSARGLWVVAHAVVTAARAGRVWALVGVNGVLAGRLLGQWFPHVPIHETVDDAVRAVAAVPLKDAPGPGPGPASRPPHR